MPDDHAYDVSPGEDGWGVERRRASCASGRFDIKEEAVQRGWELANSRQGPKQGERPSVNISPPRTSAPADCATSTSPSALP